MRILIGYMIVSMVLGLAGYSSMKDFYDELADKPEKKQHTTVKKNSDSAKVEDGATSKEEQYKKVQEDVGTADRLPILEKLDPLMTKKAFTNEIGMRGWEDYKKLMDEVKLADSKFVEESEGSSVKEVDAFFKDKKGVQRKEMNSGEKGVKQIDYWYVDKSGKKQGKSDIPVFYAEILTKFKDDKLISVSVEPGAYTVKPENIIKQSEFEDAKTIDDLLNIKNPKPMSYGVVQMEYEGFPLTNVSVLTNDGSKESALDSAVMAYFTMSPIVYNDDDKHLLMNVGAIPFTEAAKDFGNTSYVALYHYIRQTEKDGSDDIGDQADQAENISYE
ncbi:hypothetical protein [Staphylococcus caeli]|uniref:hypothetical protein n=1 Tax=Staphylococcus caeli TaxID=2201815 RepID=UPI003F55942C